MAIESLNKSKTEGCVATGLHGAVISGLAGALVPRQLLASESGSLCLFDNAAGQIYILPPPTSDWKFDFLVTVAGTSNSYSIDTDAATTFMGGGVAAVSTTVAEGGDSFVATISSTVSCDLDSDVTGRLVGTSLSVSRLSSTTCGISGTTHGVGTLATPFA